MGLGFDFEIKSLLTVGNRWASAMQHGLHSRWRVRHFENSEWFCLVSAPSRRTTQPERRGLVAGAWPRTLVGPPGASPASDGKTAHLSCFCSSLGIFHRDGFLMFQRLPVCYSGGCAFSGWFKGKPKGKNLILMHNYSKRRLRNIGDAFLFVRLVATEKVSNTLHLYSFWFLW